MPTLGQQIAIEQQQQQMSSSLPSRKQQQMFKTYTAKTQQENTRRQAVYDEALRKVSTMSLDEYKNYYSSLEPWLQQSFKSPQTIEQEKQTSVQQENKRVDEKIKKYNDMIAENRKNIEDNRIWFNSLSGKTKQSLLKSYQDKEDRYNRKIQEAQEYINQLNTTRQYVQQGASFDDVFTYVSDVVSNVTAGEEAQRQAQKKSEQAYQKLLQTPFASVYTKAKTEYGDLDWTNPRVSETLLQENWVKTYGADAFITMKTAGLTRQVYSEKGKLVTKYLDPTGNVKAIKKQDKSGVFSFQVIGEGLPQTFKQSNIEYIPISSKDVSSMIVQSGNQEGKLSGKSAIGGGGGGARGKNQGIFSNVFDFIDNLTTRKFGLITSYSAYGVPVQTVTRKSNPSFPPQQGQTNVQVDKPNFYEFVMDKYFGKSSQIPVDKSLATTDAQKSYQEFSQNVQQTPAQDTSGLLTSGITMQLRPQSIVTTSSGEIIKTQFQRTQPTTQTLTPEQLNLQASLNKIVGSPISIKESQKRAESFTEYQKQQEAQKPDVIPAYIGANVNKDEYTLIRPENTKYTFSTPTYVKTSKLEEYKAGYVSPEKTSLMDIYRGSPITLFRPFWREKSIPSGTRTPQQTSEYFQQVKKVYTPSYNKDLKLLNVPFIGDIYKLGITWGLATEESKQQRLAGLSQEEQSKAVTEEFNKISKEFEKKYPVTTKIETQEQWDKYSQDLLALKQKESALGFYEETTPEGKTILKNPLLENPNVGMYYKQLKEVKQKYGDSDWRVRAYQSGAIAGALTEATALGFITYGTGVAPAIGRGATALLGTGGSALLGAGLTVGAITERSVGLPSATIRFARGQPFQLGGEYAEFKKVGLSPTEGAIEGAFTGGAEAYGFLVGASGGEASQLRYKTFGGEKNLKTGEVEGAIKEISLFGKPLAVWQEGQAGSLSFFHYPKASKLNWAFITGSQATAPSPMSKEEWGFIKNYIKSTENPLATQGVQLEKGYKVVKELYNVETGGRPQIDLSKSESFSKLSPSQKEYFKQWLFNYADESVGLKGVANAVANKGLEKIYGSSTIEAEGGLKNNLMRPKGTYHDFDLNFRDTGMDKAQELFKGLKSAGGTPVRLQEGTSLVEIKAGGKWVHLADVHGIDNPELMLQGSPFGLGQQSTKKFVIQNEPIGGMQQIAGQRLGQSLGEKYASWFTLRGTPEEGFYVAPEGHRMKDIADALSIAERLSAVKSTQYVDKLFQGSFNRASNIQQMKELVLVNYPQVKVSTGTTTNELLFGSRITPSYGQFAGVPMFATIPLRTTPSANVKAVTTAIDVFLPQSASINKATVQTFLPSRIERPTTARVRNTAELRDTIKRLQSMGRVSDSFYSLVNIPSKTSKVSPSSRSMSMSSIVSSAIVSASSPISPSSRSASPSSKSISPSSPSSMSPYSPYSPSPSSPSVSPSYPSSISPSSPSSYSPTSPAPVTPPTWFDFGFKGGGGGGERPVKKATKEKLGYSPDFTARVLGAVAKLTPKEYGALPYKVQTGLEIRPIIQIGSTNIKMPKTSIPKSTPTKSKSGQNKDLNKKLKQLLTI